MTIILPRLAARSIFNELIEKQVPSDLMVDEGLRIVKERYGFALAYIIIIKILIALIEYYFTSGKQPPDGFENSIDIE